MNKLFNRTNALKQYLTWSALVKRLFQIIYLMLLRGGVAQWVARLTRNVEVVDLSPKQRHPLFHWVRNFTLLLSTGLLQERIQAWFHNRTRINWGPYWRLTILKSQINPLVLQHQNRCGQMSAINRTNSLCNSVINQHAYRIHVRTQCPVYIWVWPF